MKTKADTLRLWKSAYNLRKKEKTSGESYVQYTFMLIAYSNVLEMTNAQIKKQLKIK